MPTLLERKRLQHPGSLCVSDWHQEERRGLRVTREHQPAPSAVQSMLIRFTPSRLQLRFSGLVNNCVIHNVEIASPDQGVHFSCFQGWNINVSHFCTKYDIGEPMKVSNIVLRFSSC